MVAVLRRCCCARGCSGCCLVRLWGRAAWCARGRRPAREIATREPAARSGRSRSPASPAAAHGPAVRPCRPGGRLSETGVAFAHVWLCGVETGIAFACEKWVFLVRFLGAVVMPVSVVRCWGCAVVLLVSMSPWCRVWCATMFARRRCVIAKVRESSPSALKLAQIRRFCACWASFLRRCRWRGCAGRASSRQLALRRSWMRCGALQGGCGWGVCAMRSPLAACRRRVGGLDGVIPPCGGEATPLDANRPIVHVTPLSLFQDLNWRRWNCNDSGDY